MDLSNLIALAQAEALTGMSRYVITSLIAHGKLDATLTGDKLFVEPCQGGPQGVLVLQPAQRAPRPGTLRASLHRRARRRLVWLVLPG